MLLGFLLQTACRIVLAGNTVLAIVGTSYHRTQFICECLIIANCKFCFLGTHDYYNCKVRYLYVRACTNLRVKNNTCINTVFGYAVLRYVNYGVRAIHALSQPTPPHRVWDLVQVMGHPVWHHPETEQGADTGTGED